MGGIPLEIWGFCLSEVAPFEWFSVLLRTICGLLAAPFALVPSPIARPHQDAGRRVKA
jgi:hypothetical protein